MRTHRNASPTRTLYLLRHAKSSWSDPWLGDHDRPLNGRGKQAVKRLRRHMAGTGIAPDLVLCSSAQRTVMTLEGISRALPGTATVLVEDGLYGAESSHLLDRLHEVPDDVGSVMLIGHNPGIEMLASLLIGAGDDDLRRRAAAKFPTGALASLTFDRAWHILERGDATLQAFVVPRDL